MNALTECMFTFYLYSFFFPFSRGCQGKQLWCSCYLNAEAAHPQPGASESSRSIPFSHGSACSMWAVPGADGGDPVPHRRGHELRPLSSPDVIRDAAEDELVWIRHVDGTVRSCSACAMRIARHSRCELVDERLSIRNFPFRSCVQALNDSRKTRLCWRSRFAAYAMIRR